MHQTLVVNKDEIDNVNENSEGMEHISKDSRAHTSQASLKIFLHR